MYFYNTKDRLSKISAQQLLYTPRGSIDTGFYLPETVPFISDRLIYKTPAPSFREVAATVINSFFNDSIPESDIPAIVAQAFPFRVPVFPIDPQTYIIDLAQGPSGDCADFGSRLTAHLISYFCINENKPVHVLCAGGDTHILSLVRAFSDEGRVRCTVLYPKSDTAIETALASNIGDSNIYVFAVDGSLADCRTLIQQAVTDASLNEAVTILHPYAADFVYMLAHTICSVYASLAVTDRSSYDTEIENPLLVMGSPAEQTGCLSGAMLARNMNAPLKGFISSYAYTMKDTTVQGISFLSGSRAGSRSRAELLQDYERIEIMQKSRIDVQTALYQFSGDDIPLAIRDCHDRTGITLSPKSAGVWKAWQSIRKGIYTAQNSVASLNVTGKSLPQWIADAECTKSTICTIMETGHPALYPELVKKAIWQELPVPYRLRQNNKGARTGIPVLSCYEELKKQLYL